MDVTDGPFIVQNVPGTKCIMISKKKEYEKDLGSFGMQFERLVTGRKMEDCSDFTTVDHLHTMRVGDFTVLFCAEVDAIDGSGSIVEVKASNPRYWNTKVMFQMISSGSTKLCHGEKRKQILTKVLLRNLENVAKNALQSADIKVLEENILNGMNLLRNQVRDDFPYKICFGKNGLELDREESIILFPSRQVSMRLLNGYNVIQDLMLPITAEDEDMLSKVTDKNHIDYLYGRWLGTNVIEDYLKKYLVKKDLELCMIQPGRKRSHCFGTGFMSHFSNKDFEYQPYQRFSLRVPGKDIFDLKYLFFPININKKHWVCIIVYMEERRIRYCDSLGAGRPSSRSSSKNDHETCKMKTEQQNKKMNWILSYLKEEYKAKNLQEMPDESDWNLETCIDPFDAPQQDNTNDCGVFVCMFCEFVLNDCTLCFSQELIRQGQWRKKIILRILSLNDLTSTKTSDLSGDDSDPVEFVETHPLPKKSSRSTRFRGSLNEEANYLCDENFEMQTECSLLCPGSDGKDCKNKELQMWKCSFNYRTTEHPLVKVMSAGLKGEGVFAKKAIKKGTFIAEYVGKVLRKDDPKTKNGKYIMKVGDVFLDAEGCGSYAGTINHGCEPNCITQQWQVDGKMRAKIVTNKDIVEGAELWIDYKWNRGDTICHCGANKCRTFL